MSAVLLRPQPLPLERLRPGVGLLVFALHLGLLWVANLYWPLQSVLLGAVQTTAQSITVQILQRTTDRSASADNNAALSASPQAISNPGRQRFGQSEAMLELPAAQAEVSTPLAGTAQLAARAAQPVPSRPVAVTAPPPAVTSAPAPTETQARPVPQAVAAPEPVPTPVAVPVATPLQPPTAITTPPASPLPSASPPPATAAASPAATLAPAPAAAAAAAPVVSPSPAAASPATAPSNPGSATASGAALASGSGTAVPGPGSAAAPVLSLPGAPGAGGPLNLNLPPRYIYRPPIAVPRRSLSEMANEQLRRKPRDPFAEGIESAGNIDCLKETPEGPAQGLLAIGPLLKRAIEEKCRK